MKTRRKRRKCEKCTVNWEKLKITENKEIFRKCVNKKIQTRKDEKDNVTNWDWRANILTSVAEEVCGLEENNTKQWFNGREDEINQMQQEINRGRNLVGTRRAESSKEQTEESAREGTEVVVQLIEE